MSQAVGYESLDFRRETGAGMCIWEADESGCSFLIHKSPGLLDSASFWIHFVIFPLNLQVTSKFSNKFYILCPQISFCCLQPKTLVRIIIISTLQVWRSERLIKNLTKITKITEAELDLEPGVVTSIRCHPSTVRPQHTGAPGMVSLARKILELCCCSKWSHGGEERRQERGTASNGKGQLSGRPGNCQPEFQEASQSSREFFLWFTVILYQSLLQCAETQLTGEFSPQKSSWVDKERERLSHGQIWKLGSYWNSQDAGVWRLGSALSLKQEIRGRGFLRLLANYPEEGERCFLAHSRASPSPAQCLALSRTLNLF